MESKSQLLIQAASARHMKTKLIEIGKELEFESCDLAIYRLSCPHKACSVALGFDSSIKQYKVVHVYADSYGFEMLNLGSADNEWERVSGPWEDLNDRPFNPLNLSWKDPVSINGRILHWYVDSGEYIVSMQVKEGRCSITHLPKLGNVIKRNNYSLVELQCF
ncbi:hypothetical protein A4A49_53882 [Nicotiana attenuata]|uniref:Uncharacterized protein n=1 Tax=Nicotiana attenuata TaxID=49451 RepID=A0A1J6JM15_NICAT|nr:hypothetical protein A4A49_53882 [Nicotiana attenuata]